MAVRGRYLTGIVGLAVTCLLAAGLLVIASNRVKPSSVATATGLQWQSADLPVSAALSPFLASAAGRLYMVALTGRNGEARTTVSGLRSMASAGNRWPAPEWRPTTCPGPSPTTGQEVWS